MKGNVGKKLTNVYSLMTTEKAKEHRLVFSYTAHEENSVCHACNFRLGIVVNATDFR